MNEPSERNESPSAKAARELARLQQQVGQARVELAGLQRELVEAESRLSRAPSAQLLEANEQLVSSMLQAHTDAETAAHSLRVASRSAELDPLTSLPNRVLLLDRFAHAIANAKRHHSRLALLFLDLDDFKQINDTLGHAVGDEVLKVAARCLASAVREVDTVSRYGGDEFLILLDEVGRADDAIVVADKMIAALGVPHRVGGHALCLTASIGISLYPDDGEDAGTLIDRADAAMYQAKRLGLGRSAFHGEATTGSGSTAPVQARESPQQQTVRHERALAVHEQQHAQLQEANQQLVLAALDAQDLQAAAELAQQRQTDFMAMLAHELRNPLAPIRSAATLMGLNATDETMLPRLQAIIERQVMHMSRLVGDLLDVSRASTGKLRLERRQVDMAGVIDEAIDACRPAMAARSQDFSVDRPSRSLEVYGDPGRLVQVLSNLLDNASKYTPVGGEIRLAVVVADDAIVMTVSDNGIGITAQALPEVFKPFVQDAHATSFNGVGLGIGLTVVRELVEAHGGSVTATSAGSGLGSRFVVTLPLIETTTSRPTGPAH